jgi:peptide/nickel transport system permease protein
MGLVMFTAFFVIIGNLLADVAVALLDPRVRLS